MVTLEILRRYVLEMIPLCKDQKDTSFPFTSNATICFFISNILYASLSLL